MKSRQTALAWVHRRHQCPSLRAHAEELQRKFVNCRKLETAYAKASRWTTTHASLQSRSLPVYMYTLGGLPLTTMFKKMVFVMRLPRYLATTSRSNVTMGPVLAAARAAFLPLPAWMKWMRPNFFGDHSEAAGEGANT